MENDQNSAQETTVQKFEDLPSTDIAKSLKEKSKKWLKFVTQVHFQYLIIVFLIFNMEKSCFTYDIATEFVLMLLLDGWTLDWLKNF